METTGPDFLGSANIEEDLSYPDIAAAEWVVPEAILDYTLNPYAHTNPPNVLYWEMLSIPTPKEKNAEDAFRKDCDQYRKILSAAFFAKRFGDNHPFNIKIKKYLIDHFPYNAGSFKELLKVNFDSRHKDIILYYPLELKEGVKDLKEGVMYLEKHKIEGEDIGNLQYTILNSDKSLDTGILPVEFHDYQDLTSNLNYYDFRSKVRKIAEKQGKIKGTKSGISYEEWKKEAFNMITTPGKYNQHNHYVTLIYTAPQSQEH